MFQKKFGHRMMWTEYFHFWNEICLLTAVLRSVTKVIKWYLICSHLLDKVMNWSVRQNLSLSWQYWMLTASVTLSHAVTVHSLNITNTKKNHSVLDNSTIWYPVLSHNLIFLGQHLWEMKSHIATFCLSFDKICVQLYEKEWRLAFENLEIKSGWTNLQRSSCIVSNVGARLLWGKRISGIKRVIFKNILFMVISMDLSEKTKPLFSL